jgi:hypothetical protein
MTTTVRRLLMSSFAIGAIPIGAPVVANAARHRAQRAHTGHAATARTDEPSESSGSSGASAASALESAPFAAQSGAHASRR